MPHEGQFIRYMLLYYSYRKLLDCYPYFRIKELVY